MKKVLFLHPSYSEQTMGGAELQISFLANFLVDQGYEIHFIFEDKKTPITNPNNYFLHPLKKIKISKILGNPRFLYYKKISLLIKNIKPDIIYSRSYNSWSGFASIYANHNKIKHIWAVASDKDVENKLSWKMTLKPLDFIQYFIANKAFKLSSVIIVQNDFQRKMIQSQFSRKAVKISQLGEQEKGSNIRKSQSKINILWIANLKPNKHPEYFLSLVKTLSSLSNCNFIMIGRPHSKYHSAIKELEEKEEKFKYLGELTNNKVNELLCKSHILVNTSDFEGFSNTFVQAWMRGVIVLSMNSNPDKILTKQKIGMVCRTVNELNEMTSFLVKNTDIRMAMSDKALKYAIENHSIKKNMSKVLKLMS